MDNEQIIRKAYQIAEDKDSEGWLAAFTPDGTFTDESIGVTYRGRDRAFPLENFGQAFSDMHRELYRGSTCTATSSSSSSRYRAPNDGPLSMAGGGVLEPTGNRMDAPCCDVFELDNGKIKRFDCYPSGTVILGVLGAAVRPTG